MKTTRTTTRIAAVLGLALVAATPALAEPREDSQDFLTTPGIGVVENVGNNAAADVKMFATGERPQALYRYDVATGTYVASDATKDRTRPVEQAEGPAIDFGLDVN